MKDARIRFGVTDGGKALGIDLAMLRTSHLLATGTTSSGKSYLMRVLLERFAPQVQQIVIDPEGEYQSLREKFPFVLVGEGGETPARVDTAALLARRLMETGASAVCDLYALEREEQQEWVRVFLEALMQLPKELYRPAILAVDEAHLFAPEKGEGSASSTRALENVASRIAKKYFGLIVATQRITKLSNNVVSECQNYLIGRTFMQVDRERAAKALGVPSRAAEREAFFEDLKVLARGEFWALGVAMTNDRAKVTVDAAETTHPKRGEVVATVKPPTPEQVRALLPQLADLPKEAAAEQGEVEALKSELEQARRERDELVPRCEVAEREWSSASTLAAELEQQLTALKAEAQELRARPALRPDLYRIMAKVHQCSSLKGMVANGMRELDVVKERMAELDGAIDQVVWNVEQEIRDMESELDGLASSGTYAEVNRERAFPIASVTVPVKPEGLRQAVTAAAAPALSVRVAAERANSDGKVPKACIAVLREIAAYDPKWVSKKRVAAAVGTSASKSTWRGYMAPLRENALIEENESELRLTAAGRALAGGGARVRTTAEVLAKWEAKLSERAMTALKELVRVRGQATSKEMLAGLIGTNTKSSTWRGYMAELRSAGLVSEPSDSQIAANREALFL